MADRQQFLNVRPADPELSDQLEKAKKRGAPEEIEFEVRDDEEDGGYIASAVGYGIHTQGETMDELRTMVRDAVACYFDEGAAVPKAIRLHIVRDEVLA
jgi:predicted RNase H-like HicB family nuclease